MIKRILVIAVFIVAGNVFADTELTAYLKNMHSIQADFSQAVIDKKGKVLQKSKGHMALQRPSQFRWEVRSPVSQLIVTNGKRLWVYDPDLEQVTVRALATNVGETPVLLLSNEALNLEKEFRIDKLPSKNLEWFTLRPKDPQNTISQLKLGFNQGKFAEMQLQDHLGHTTFIKFSNVKLNENLPAGIFNFEFPPNVDIIDETKHR